MAANCFDGSKFPKLLKSDAPDGDSVYFAITGTDEKIYLGGFTKDGQIKPLSQSRQAVLTKIDITTNKIDWSVALASADGYDLHQVTGLTLNE